MRISDWSSDVCSSVLVAGKVISYTGDSDWTKHMPEVARDADLFITECYFYEKPIRFHMNYPKFQEHRNELTAKRIVLTHFSREMMQIGRASCRERVCQYV